MVDTTRARISEELDDQMHLGNHAEQTYLPDHQSRGNTGETRKRLREQLKSVDRGSLVPAPGAEGGAKGKVAEPPGSLRGLQIFDP